MVRHFLAAACVFLGGILFIAMVTVAPALPATAQDNPTLPPTNTPRGAVDAPTPTPVPATPTSPSSDYGEIPPTPTVYYPPHFTPAPQGTAIPTAMPRLLPRDPDGNSYNVVNIVLIGHDSESLQVDNVFRTDTMIIVNINLTTETVSMLALPRDLLVWISGWGMQRLNLAWGRGDAVGWTDGGWGLFRQTVLYNFGIELHYYAVVDFTGFKNIIDRLDGVTIAVDCPMQDWMWTGEYDENDEPVFEMTTLPVGVHHLDSREALWYARTRRTSSDFDRGRRQQQILRAIWSGSRDAGLITQLPEIWGDIGEIAETNIPLSMMLTLTPLALQLQPNEIANYFFRINYETTPWTTPSGDNVQVPNPAMITLIRNFLTPPTSNQTVSDVPRIQIYDGSGSGAYWDQVAADRLIWEGILAEASGEPDQHYEETVIIDYTGSTRGSILPDLMGLFNVRQDSIEYLPDPNRTVDFEIFLGENYNSCVDRQVQMVE